ncbi:DUF1980 domain-containing protein [Bacillus sp. V3-13]|uniref:DUF1980 domain-containing protein n=1 Tax=Bacillus sp. V3-13 TaxID=2053728 RepID=UPI0015E08E9F|nr:DUF1980 domain-containing protein [Bacillus sp. V3-13]
MKGKEPPSWQTKNELQGILLIGFSLVIFKLYVTKNISVVLEPKMTSLIMFTMLSLFIIGFFRLWNSDMKGADCDCEVCDTSSSSLRIVLQYSLFLFPIILALIISDFTLDTDILSK